MSHTMSPLTRRAVLHGGARLALALTALLGGTRAADVHAGKNRKKKPKIGSVAERTEDQRQSCEAFGGQLAVMDGPDGCGCNTTECKGGGDGLVCTNTPKKTSCSYPLTDPTDGPLDDVHTPPTDGNEDPRDPSSPVTDPVAPPAGGNEQPSGGDEPPSGGGGQPGGGGAVGPGGTNEQPSDVGSGDGGGVILYASHGSTPRTATRPGARRRRRRGKGRRR
jgi:hypothetical protein